MLDCYDFMTMNRRMSSTEQVFSDAKPRDLMKDDSNIKRTLYGDDEKEEGDERD